MKKSFRKVLSLLCLSPLLLCACGASSYYNISAISSSSALGSVSGFSADKVIEGATVTLTARENNPETNPLVAWVKNNEYLVKIAGDITEEKDGQKDTKHDTSLTLISSEATAGKYTAVFAEDSQSMMYAYISETSFTIDEQPQAKETYSYQISYAIMSAGSDNFIPYQDKIGEGINTNILYFGGLGQNYQFKFKVEVSFNVGTEENSEKIVETITNQNWVSKDNFLSELKFEFDFKEGAQDKHGMFTLRLAKFSPDMKSFTESTE